MGEGVTARKKAVKPGKSGKRRLRITRPRIKLAQEFVTGYDVLARLAYLMKLHNVVATEEIGMPICSEPPANMTRLERAVWKHLQNEMPKQITFTVTLEPKGLKR